MKVNFMLQYIKIDKENRNKKISKTINRQYNTTLQSHIPSYLPTYFVLTLIL